MAVLSSIGMVDVLVVLVDVTAPNITMMDKIPRCIVKPSRRSLCCFFCSYVCLIITSTVPVDLTCHVCPPVCLFEIGVEMLRKGRLAKTMLHEKLIRFHHSLNLSMACLTMLDVQIILYAIR